MIIKLSFPILYINFLSFFVSGKSPNIPKVELKQNFRMALNKSPCVEALPEETQCHEYRYFKFKGALFYTVLLTYLMLTTG